MFAFGDNILVSWVETELIDCAVYDTGIFIPTKKHSKHIKDSKERWFIMTQTQFANFRGKPLCQATKRHLKNS